MGHILSNENVAKHLSSKGNIIQEIGGVQYYSVCLGMVINIKKRNSFDDVYLMWSFISYPTRVLSLFLLIIKKYVFLISEIKRSTLIMQDKTQYTFYPSYHYIYYDHSSAL